MKLGLIVPGGVDRSGVERVIPRLLWLIERLSRQHEVHVFALRQEPLPSTYPLLGATVHNMGRWPRRLRALRALLAEHARGPFDVLHAFWVAPQGVLATAAGALLGVPVVVHAIGADFARLPEIGYGLSNSVRGSAWLQAVAYTADCITVQSEAMRLHGHALGVRTMRIPDGIELERWPPRAPRAQLHDPVRLLQVADLNGVKDQTTLLRAFKQLRDIRPAQLDIVGEDTLDGQLHRLAEELGIARDVRFHGRLPHARLRAIYEHSDLLVVTSLWESGPIAALEAAIAGVPVVGTDVGHLTEWAGDAALVVPPGDAAGLAEAMLQLLSDEGLRCRIAQRAQARALQESMERTCVVVEEIGTALQRRRQPFLTA